MARGIQIPLTLDIGKFVSGIRTVETDVEQLATAFQEVEQAADQVDMAGLSDEVKAETQAAEAALEGLESSFDELGPAARNAGDEMDGALSDGLSQASSAKVTAGAIAGEIVDEFVENWGEAVRSGDYAGAIRETLSQLGQIGGAVGGPAGAAIGGGIALAATTVFDQFMNTEGKAKIKAALEASTDGIDVDLGDAGYQAGQTYIEGYDRAMREQANRENALMELYGVDEYEAALRAAAAEVDNLGVAWGTIEDVTAGTTTETKAAVGNLKEQAQVIDAEIAAAYENAKGPAGKLTTEQQQQVDKLRAQRSRLNDLVALGEDRLGTVQDTAAAFDAQAASLVRVKGNAEDVARAIENIPDKHSVDVEIEYQGELQRFNADMFAAVRPKYQQIFIETIYTESYRYDAARSRGNTVGQPVAD